MPDNSLLLARYQTPSLRGGFGVRKLGVTRWLGVVLFFVLMTKTIGAIEGQPKVTTVNPLRAREVWVDQDLGHLDRQYEVIKRQEVASTWLIQGDVLNDREIVERLKNFDKAQEVGILLEISQKLAENANVIYPAQTYWYNPRAVFLSGYDRKERKRLIDQVYMNFYGVFGKWPKSVGAWWIDSYSLEYIKNKYGLKTAMIVADQKNTDGYGVWGQWVGVPYYPSKHNLLTPASSENNKLAVTIIQWAQRDPLRAYLGEGPKYSNYSVQANDYLKQGETIEYFDKISKIYLDNGQLTIGLEVGQEAVGNLDELEKQIARLKKARVNFVTMGQFGDDFFIRHPRLVPEVNLGGWNLGIASRENRKLGQYVEYNQDVAFGDYWLADRNDFLDRNLEKLANRKREYFPVWGAVLLLITVMALAKRWEWWAGGSLIIINSWGLLLKSGYHLGWKVMYGTEVDHLVLVQTLVVATGTILVFKLRKKIKWWLGSFGLVPAISAISYSVINGQKHLGMVWGLTFLGIRWGNEGVGLAGNRMPGRLVGSFLHFPWDRIWDSPFLGIVAYPLVMLGLGITLNRLTRNFNLKLKRMIWWLLMAMMVINLGQVFASEPRLVSILK